MDHLNKLLLPAINSKDFNRMIEVLIEESNDTDFLDSIAKMKSFTVNIYKKIASNASTSAETLDYLSKNFSVSVRKAVAKNNNTSAKTLNFLAKDKSKIICLCVSKNPNVPEEALDYLAKSMFEIVRISVAQNPKTSSVTLDYLCKKELSEKVLLHVVSNHHVLSSSMDFLYHRIDSKKIHFAIMDSYGL